MFLRREMALSYPLYNVWERGCSDMFNVHFLTLILDWSELSESSTSIAWGPEEPFRSLVMLRALVQEKPLVEKALYCVYSWRWGCCSLWPSVLPVFGHWLQICSWAQGQGESLSALMIICLSHAPASTWTVPYREQMSIRRMNEWMNECTACVFLEMYPKCRKWYIFIKQWDTPESESGKC